MLLLKCNRGIQRPIWRRLRESTTNDTDCQTHIQVNWSSVELFVWDKSWRLQGEAVHRTPSCTAFLPDVLGWICTIGRIMYSSPCNRALEGGKEVIIRATSDGRTGRALLTPK